MAAPRHAGRARPVVASGGRVAPGTPAAARESRISPALRANPAAVRKAAFATMAAGAVLFVIAGLTTPVAGADTSGRAASAGSGTAGLLELLHADVTATSAPAAARPAPVSKVVVARAVSVAKPAPANSAVISGLAANGIPSTALNAYRVAAARTDNADPGCGIDWALLAGIGREESDHGQFGGAVLHTDGTSTPRIIGPALDGKGSAFIAAPPDGIALDGDPLYTHALGPMQFIPQTWAMYGADGNGDGRADIFNIYDAALGAARYLCAAGGDLHTHAGQVTAVLAYNHSDQYLAQVLALANAYRNGIPISGIPIGNITGALPPVHSGAVPPANPGPPTAAGKSTHASKPVTKKKKKVTPKPSPAPSSGSPSASHSPGPGKSSSPGGTHSSSPAPSPSPTPSTSTPKPSSSSSCNAVDHLLGTC